MNTIDAKKMSQGQVDPIEDYLECVTYCSISSNAEENDCQTICMERHLKSSYFQTFSKNNTREYFSYCNVSISFQNLNTRPKYTDLSCEQLWQKSL